MGNYNEFSAFLGSYPEMACFRTFSKLSMLQLLYMQAELVNLEVELQEVTLEDEQSSSPHRSKYGESWDGLSQSIASASRDSIQYRTYLRMEQKLSAYHKALLRQKKIRVLTEPESDNLKYLRKWLVNLKGGKAFLRGSIEDVWHESQHHEDLVQLGPVSRDKDSVSRIVYWLIPLVQEKIESRMHPQRDIFHTSETTLVKVADATSTILLCSLLVVSTIVLHNLASLGARLATILGFNVILTIMLSFVLRARRVEVFAATTAFAAVQLVFIGGSKV